MLIHNGYICVGTRKEYGSIYISNGIIKRIYKSNVRLHDIDDVCLDACGNDICAGGIGIISDIRDKDTSVIYKKKGQSEKIFIYKCRKANQAECETDVIVGYGFENNRYRIIEGYLEQAYNIINKNIYKQDECLNSEQKILVEIISKTKPVVININNANDAKCAYQLNRKHRLPIIIISESYDYKDKDSLYISKIWGISHKLGSIKVGKDADIVICDKTNGDIMYKIIKGEMQS